MRYLFLLFLIFSSELHASLVIHVGSIQVGNGGANPLAIPPTELAQYELVWVRESLTEWSLGITPGILFGKRVVQPTGVYASGGFGLVIDQNASGPGIYMAVGYENCSLFCWNIEYKGALGVSQVGLIQPYAVRIGVSIFN